MSRLLQPIDLAYFKTTYFLVTTLIAIVVSAVAAWRIDVAESEEEKGEETHLL